MHRATGRLTTAAALAFALAAVGAGNALAAPGDAASAPDGAAVSYAAGSQITVKPGQSLNDIAIAVTQSHDRATLARASRAMFDANPNAFMSHDPSRLRMGAALTVPALDATGAAAVAGSAPVAAAAVSVSTPNAAVAGGVASSVAQVNAAAASAASAASAAAAASATPAVTGTASAAAEAAPAIPGSVVSSASAPVAGSQAAAAASGTHEWSGSIQSSASEAGQGASAPAGTAAATASQARVQVSSLQQLLALKNRVLMELQKHGIGGSAPVPAAAVATSGAPAAGASSAAAVSGQPGAATSTSNATGMSETSLSVAAAIGAALVVLLAALRMGRRKRAAAAAAAAAEGSLARDAALAAANASAAQNVVTTREAFPVDGVTDVSDEAAVRHAATEREAAENDAAHVTDEAHVRHVAAEHGAAYSDAATRETAEREAAEHAEAERAEAEREAAEHAAAEHVERAAADSSLADSTPVHEASAAEAVDHPSEQAAFPTPGQHASQAHSAAGAHDAPHFNPDATDTSPTAAEAELLPAEHHENLEGATTAASLAAAAELGADALPLTSFEPVDETFEHEEPQHLQWDDEPAPSAEPAEPHHEYAPPPIPVEQTQHAPKAPTEFPRDALDAFNSLDMPLPPRIESDDDLIGLPPLTTHPVASPESTARQAVAPHDPQDAPHIADEIAAGTAGAAAVAGLGAAGFGALKLDFDLELPPSPAQPLPAFTQADLGRIARNKLDLAAEYIDLGDLAGARTLINEVIEANDPATRTEARALLSTLAPLS